MTLCRVIPPKAISLNGELALAFGARGHGLSGARAHYEPRKVAINLTKMNGAGSLAHEWFHALDHYFGRQDGKSVANTAALNLGGVTPSATATKASPNQKLERSSRSTRDSYRLSDSEIESLRREMKASSEWMKEQLRIDPELKHI